MPFERRSHAGIATETLPDFVRAPQRPVPSALALTGMGEAIAMSAQEIAPWPVQLGDAPLAGDAEQHASRVTREVLNEAVAAGGSSLRDHRKTDGALGYFQHSFRVYGRDHEPCARCGRSPKGPRNVLLRRLPEMKRNFRHARRWLRWPPGNRAPPPACRLAFSGRDPSHPG
jgi:hypothetical protein